MQVETHDVNQHGAYVRKGSVPSRWVRAYVRTVARVTESARPQVTASKRDFIKNNFDPPKIFQDFGSYWSQVARFHSFKRRRRVFVCFVGLASESSSGCLHDGDHQQG